MKHKIFIIFIFLSLSCFSQNQEKLHSLWQKYNSTIQDTSKVKLLLKIGDVYEKSIPDSAIYFYSRAEQFSDSNLAISTSSIIKQSFLNTKGTALRYMGVVISNHGEYDKAMQLYKKGIEIFKKTNNDLSIGKTYISIANILTDRSQFDESLKYNKQGLDIFTKHNFSRGINACNNNLGLIYKEKGKYTKSTEYFLSALKGFEKNNNTRGMALCYINLGINQFSQNNLNVALNYYNKSLELSEKSNNMQAVSLALLNIAAIKFRKGDVYGAIDNNFKSLKIAIKLNDLKRMSTTYNNIGQFYVALQQYDTAFVYYNKAMELKIRLVDKTGLSSVYGNMANLFHEQGLKSTSYKQKKLLLNKGIKAGKKAFDLAVEINSDTKKLMASNILYNIYSSLKNYKEAYKYTIIYLNVNNNIFSKEKTKALTEMEAKYKSKKRQQEIEKQEILIDKQKADIKTQNRQKIFLLLGLLLMLIIAFVILSYYRQKKKANFLLSNKNAIIRAKNKKNTDSIVYAERIQKAILPSKELIKANFSDYFLLFKPKDIVSGDFYWMTKEGNKTYFAEVDCTGHGVPGAFMSMIANTLLNKIIETEKISTPSLILDKLTIEVSYALNQNSKSQDDGMDISLCCINKDTNTVEIACTNQTPVIIHNGEMQIIKGDYYSIGEHRIKKKNFKFRNNVIKLQKGMIIYLFSDGYADQFGGVDDTKFMRNKLQNLLLQNSNLAMDIQKEKLNNIFEEWKGNNVQIDDILIAGIKI